MADSGKRTHIVAVRIMSGMMWAPKCTGCGWFPPGWWDEEMEAAAYGLTEHTQCVPGMTYVDWETYRPWESAEE